MPDGNPFSAISITAAYNLSNRQGCNFGAGHFLDALASLVVTLSVSQIPYQLFNFSLCPPHEHEHEHEHEYEHYLQQ